MRLSSHLTGCLLLAIAWGCTAAPPPRGVVRIDRRDPPKTIAGPMPGFGPFDSLSDALISACPLILSLPRATAGRRDEQGFNVRWRVSSEYCAWLYYTPDEKYEMSMLVESTDPLPLNELDERTCGLPAFVEDSRYAPGSLKHIYVLHNHPSPISLSMRDVQAIARAAKIHGRFVETKEGKIPVSIVAFFANAYAPERPACDGFFEYNVANYELVKWVPEPQGRWRREKVGTITLSNEGSYRFTQE